MGLSQYDSLGEYCDLSTASSVFLILSHFVDIRFKDNSNEVWGIKQVFELLTVIK